MNKSKRWYYAGIILGAGLAVVLVGSCPAWAQFYGGGYNNYGGGGYNNYGGGGYNNYGGGGYNNYGGGYGYGGSGMGFGQRSFGMGSMRGGRGGMSGMGSGMGSGRGSGRSSRRGGNYGNYNNNYGGGMQSGYGSRSRRSQNYGNTGGLGGVVPQSAQGQGNEPKQTTSSGQSADRKRALAGKSNRGALPAGQGGSAGGIQVQGSSNVELQQPRLPGNPALPAQPGQPQRGKPAPKKEEVKTRPTAMFYVDTPNPSLVVNQPFSVIVALSNTGKVEYDHLAFTLYFDPADIEPISGVDEGGAGKPLTSIPLTPPAPEAGKDEKAAAAASPDEGTGKSAEKSTSNAPDGGEEAGSFIAKNQERYKIIRNEVDAVKGMIRFEAESVGQTSKDSGLIAQIQFMPLRVTSTSLSFVFSDPFGGETEGQGQWTALTLKGADQLGSRFMEADGVVNLNLNVFETLEKAREKPSVKDLKAQSKNVSEDAAAFGTQITLVPRQEQIDVGDEVDVDVVLDNPHAEMIDAVSLLIAYNPRVFEAVDLDDFSPGVNLSDEEYRAKFPFDFPMVNEIETDKGVIDYRKKTVKKPIRADGVFATFRLRAVRPTTKTTFRVFLNEKGEEPTTGAFYHFQDRLGDPADPFDGVTTCSLTVRPTTAYLSKLVK
ncbi:MAG: cohesin domain-containing protein [bacterium]